MSDDDNVKPSKTWTATTPRAPHTLKDDGAILAECEKRLNKIVAEKKDPLLASQPIDGFLITGATKGGFNLIPRIGDLHNNNEVRRYAEGRPIQGVVSGYLVGISKYAHDLSQPVTISNDISTMAHFSTAKDLEATVTALETLNREHSLY